MIKVLIVDDEPFIRQGLRILIDWGKHDCEVIGEASNGREAIEIIENNSVDLVITDIKMPEINGMELIKQIKESNHSDIKFIVLSGFYEFEYAKTAIKYGVKDYVLKPIQKDELNRVLDEFQKEFKKEQDHINKIEKVQKASREMNLNKLILGKADSKIIEAINEEINPSDYLRFILVDIDFGNMTVDERNECKFNFYMNIKDLMQEYEMNLISELDDKKNKYSIGFIYDRKFLDESIFDEKEYFNDLVCKIRKVVDKKFYVYVGKAVNEIENLKNSYESASILKIVAGDKNIIIYDDIYKENCPNEIIKKEYMDNLINAVEEYDKEEIQKCVQNFYDSFRDSLIDIEIIKINIDYLIFNLINIEKNVNNGSDNEELINLMELLDIENIVSRDGSKNLEYFSLNFADYLNNLRKNSAKGILSYIDKEIYEHYMDKLSLKSLSEKYYLNSAYLGQMFKKKYKVSFKDYLNEYRIEKAAEILKRSDEKIYEIAKKVGYSNNDYFINKFTQIKGKTPFKYRKEFLEQEQNVL